MKKSIMAMAILGVVGAVVAQANDPWAPTLNLGISLTDGNTDTLGVNLGLVAGVGAEEDANHARLTADWNYGEVDGENTVQNTEARLTYERTLSDVTFAYGNVGFLNDDIAEISYRVPASVGIGYVAWQDAAAKLILEAGPAYIWEKVAGETDDYFALRAAQSYFRALSDTARLWQTVEYLPEAADFDHYLLNFEIGTEAAVNSSVALRVVFKNRYDSEPAPDAKKNDLQLLAGLAYRL